MFIQKSSRPHCGAYIVAFCLFYYTPGCRRWRRPRWFGDWYTHIILFPCVYYNNIISARTSQPLSQMTGEVRTARPPQTVYSTIYISYSYVVYTNMLYLRSGLIAYKFCRYLSDAFKAYKNKCSDNVK